MVKPKNEDQIEEITPVNIVIDNNEILKLISPFAMFVAGCTGSGKTVTVLNWLKNPKNIFKTNFTKIFYFYGSTFQEKFKDPKLSHIYFSNKLTLLEKISSSFHKPPGILIILDDLLNETSDTTIIQKLYTKGSHHLNISVINIVQSIFFKSKNFTILKDNSQYTYVKCHVNEMKLKILANALGVDINTFMESYSDSISKSRFEGILIDNHVQSDIRKISKIRDNLTKNVGLYIDHKKFIILIKKGIFTRIRGKPNNFLLHTSMLRDEVNNQQS